MRALQLSLTLFSSVFAAFYDVKMKLPYWKEATRSLEVERMKVVVRPYTRSEFQSVLKVSIPINWNAPMTGAEFSNIIQDSWTNAFGNQFTFDSTGIAELSKENMGAVIYRSKHYNNGFIKMRSFVKEHGEDKVELHIESPPVTPGENRCYLWHQQQLTEAYNRRIARHCSERQFLETVINSCNLPCMPDFNIQVPENQVVSVEELEVKIAEIDAVLKKVNELKARLHIELATWLVAVGALVKGPEEVEKYKNYRDRLPAIPQTPLTAEEFLNIHNFVAICKRKMAN